MSEKCKGCGVTLNFEDEKDIGYVHPSNKDHLCQRCYQMIHFNKVPDTYLQNEQYEMMFDEIVKHDKLIIWVIDIFDFNGSYHKFIVDKLKGRPILIIANKVDILPKSVKTDKIKKWVKESLSDELSIIDIIITSAIKKKNVDEILEKIYLLGVEEVYIVGTANVGKSTLINKLIKSVDGTREDTLTTSYYSGTTLGVVGVKVSPKLTVYDTPGIINKEQVNQYLSQQSLKVVIPKNELRPTTFQLYQNQTLFITGLAQIDYLEGDKINFTVYASNKIEVHRTNYDNAEKIREKHYGNSLLQVPTLMEIPAISTFETHIFEIDSNKDIFISGLCFVALKGVRGKAKVAVTVPKKISVDIRNNLI